MKRPGHLGYLSRLVVAPEESDSVWPPRLEDHQPGEGLQAVVASVHEVSHEDVVGVWGWTSLSEQLLQVVELSMDVSTHLMWEERKE